MEINQENTQAYFKKLDIQYGDMFSEMCSFWVIVVSVENDRIITLEGSSIFQIKEYDTIESFSHIKV